MKLNLQKFADGEISYKVVLDSNGAIKNLEKLEDKSSKLNGVLSKAGSIGAGAFKAVSAGVVASGTAVASLIGYGVTYNAEIEQLTTSFEVMTGSAEKAAEITEKLKQMGAETPFETKDLAEVTQLLMNYGIEADTAIERMSMLGDISQGSADKMQRIAMAYGQMSSAGKVSLEDIKQMIEAGFNPLQEISDTTGESMASLYDRISDGTLSIDEITASMKRSTSEGGKYFKSMEKQSKTLNGQISALKDNFSSLAGTLANDVSGQLTTTILPEINQLISDMELAFSEGGIPAMIEVMSSGITEMAVSLVEQLPQFIQIGTQVVSSIISGISSNKESLVNSIVLALNELITAFLNMLPEILELGIQLILALINGIAEQAPELVPQIIDCVLLIATTLLNNIDLIIQAGMKLLVGLATGLIKAIPNLVIKIPEIIKAIVDAFGDGIKSIVEIGKAMIEGLWEGIKSMGSWIGEKVGGFFTGIADGVKDLLGINSPSKLFFEFGGYVDEGFIDGIDYMEKDIKKQIDSTFGTGLDYLYNGYDNFNISLPDTTFLNSQNQIIYLENSNNNTSVLTVDGKVLAESVNEYNERREVAV